MIDFNFCIRNPWSNRWSNIKTWHGSTWFENKFWEIEIFKTTDIISLSFRLTHRQDHAGLYFGFGLLGYSLNFNFYDNRHWTTDVH